ncbi:MAG TPA: PLP-dependent aminotransferase family protein [Actinospica sp.]|nr:PLP-dependent aminotransferase family protein [Actinospica sp.]
MPRSKPEPNDRSKTGPDFLQLDITRAPRGAVAGWLTEQLRAAIADGRLPIGNRVPPGRVLAEELRVSRGVVTEAYRRLIEGGQLAGRGRAGTFVVAAPVAPPPTSLAADPHPRTDFAAPPAADVFDLLRASPADIDLTPGVPDLAAFPRGAWLRAERRVLDALDPAHFGYGDPRGAPSFRRAVADWLARNRGIRVDPEHVVIVTGVAQALDLVSRILMADGVDEIAVEDPGSLGVRQHLASRDLRTPPIPVDEQGMRVEPLYESGARVVALTPAHQFPTGVVLDGGRRRDLVKWAEDTGGLIVEDDYDAEHRYDRPPVPAVRALLPDHVFYTGSVSKTLAPALRTGWLIPPPRYREQTIVAKRYADLGNAVLPQLVLTELMESGELERHLRTLRRRHRRRRDAMIVAIRTHLPAAHIHGAAAGLHLTITFDAAFKDTDLAAAALDLGVKTQPLSWHYQVPSAPGLVLGYAATPPTDAARAIELIGSALGDRKNVASRR